MVSYIIKVDQSSEPATIMAVEEYTTTRWDKICNDTQELLRLRHDRYDTAKRGRPLSPFTRLYELETRYGGIHFYIIEAENKQQAKSKLLNRLNTGAQNGSVESNKKGDPYMSFIENQKIIITKKISDQSGGELYAQIDGGIHECYDVEIDGNKERWYFKDQIINLIEEVLN